MVPALGKILVSPAYAPFVQRPLIILIWNVETIAHQEWFVEPSKSQPATNATYLLVMLSDFLKVLDLQLDEASVHEMAYLLLPPPPINLHNPQNALM
jgi:hypothetical protein